MYIDCTGDGDLAAMAGVPMQTDECKPLQPLSTYFILGGVDTDSPMIIDAMPVSYTHLCSLLTFNAVRNLFSL